MTRVLSPVPGFTGEVAGVAFAHGEGHTDNRRALEYFQRHGYHIGTDRPPRRVLDTEAIEQIEAHGGRIEERDGEQVVVIPVANVLAEIDPDPAEADQADEAADPSSADTAAAVGQPSKNASHEVWAAYAVSLGADPDTAAALKRDELIANYGTTEQGEG